MIKTNIPFSKYSCTITGGANFLLVITWSVINLQHLML